MNTYSGEMLENKIKAFRAKHGLDDSDVAHQPEARITVRQERRSVAEWLQDTFTTKTTPLSLR